MDIKKPASAGTIVFQITFMLIPSNSWSVPSLKKPFMQHPMTRKMSEFHVRNVVAISEVLSTDRSNLYGEYKMPGIVRNAMDYLINNNFKESLGSVVQAQI